MITKNDGFSLLEILCVLSITLLLLTIGIPGFKSLYQTSSANRLAMQWLTALRIARSEAVLRNQVVILCKSMDQKSCSGHWEDGYLIQTPTQIISAFKNKDKSEGVISWQPFQVNREYLKFLPAGDTQDVNGKFTYHINNQLMWTIIVNKAGQARLTT